MAISKSQKGVEIFITINGVPAKEHSDALDETEHEHPDHTVLHYIESISDANFSIVAKVHPAYKLKASLEFLVQVDRHTMPFAPLFVPPEGPRGTWTYTVDGKHEIGAGGRSKRLFRFAKIDLVDDQDVHRIRRDARAAARMGEVRVSVSRKQILQRKRGDMTGGGGEGMGLQIAEKAVKGQALSHGTAFEDAVAVRSKTTLYETKPSRGRDSPVAVFIFRYRSKETLQYMRILPRPPTPDILDSFSREELREMARGRRFGKQFTKEEQSRVKRERSAGDDEGVRKFTNDDEVLTIDLTGDEAVETRVPKRARMSKSVDLTDD